MSHSDQQGWLHVVSGPMFSGKTEELLRLVRRLHYADRRAMVFRPDVDTRDADNGVMSRSGAYFPAVVAHTSGAIADIGVASALDVIAVDEAQFFDNNLPGVLNDAANAGIIVIVSGLDRDFAGRTFGPMGELLVLADEVTKLSAICVVCKLPASCTQRLINGQPARYDDPLVVIGGKGDDRYEARCRYHHEVW